MLASEMAEWIAMYVVELITEIAAPIERCFDLARSVDLHVASTSETAERAVGGRTSGLLGMNEDVTWEAVHLGVRQRLTSRITAYDRPHFFQDTMQKGAFKSLEHEHHFDQTSDGTRMRDVLRFEAPMGPIGWVVERALLAGHLRRFLKERNHVFKQAAESEQWRRFLRVPGGDV